MWELAANWHRQRKTTKQNQQTHTHKIYAKQQQKMGILGLFTMTMEGGGTSREGGTDRGGGGGGESLITFWGTSLC